jgi:hypothetical protein
MFYTTSRKNVYTTRAVWRQIKLGYLYIEKKLKEFFHGGRLFREKSIDQPPFMCHTEKANGHSRPAKCRLFLNVSPVPKVGAIALE